MARKLKPQPQSEDTADMRLIAPKFREYEPTFNPASIEYKSLDELLKEEKDGKRQIAASICEYNPKRKEIRERAYSADKLRKAVSRFKEAGLDPFGTSPVAFSAPGLVGDDYVPLIAGPINKQQYLQSYLQGQAECFFAYHHDPFARGAVNVLKHFTLGKGFRADCDDKAALALWKAFEIVNHIQDMMGYIAIELPVQGEVMPYWIPDNKIYVDVDNPKALQSPKGVLPRVRLLDTSAIWEVITAPEDITRVFAYQQVYIGQYQSYTTKVDDTSVPIAKTIIRQIPAHLVDHYKVNCLSGEKRGRSDMYPVLGFLKRLRDTIQYAVIQEQKHSAFAFDTMVDGSPADLQAYADAVASLGQMPQAGSDFIHSKKVTRQMLSPGGTKGSSAAFDWCLSAFCAGFGIPMNFLGTHLSGGQTRASALTATEPAYKRFEDRQNLYKRILGDMAQRLFKINNVQAEIEFTFPDLLNQDRTAKLNQLLLAQEAGWISRERAANIAAAELGITEFKFDQEKTVTPPEEAPKPLSTPGTMGGGMTGGQRASVRDNQ